MSPSADGAYVTLYLSEVMKKFTDDELATSIAHHTDMLRYLYAEQAQRESCEKVRALGVQRRFINPLLRARIESAPRLAQMVRECPADLLKLRGFGKIGLAKVREALTAKGYLSE